jgi:hypothetical protein
MFIIFSGHNDRAVIALCRFFDRYKIHFAIIAALKNDLIFETSWRKKVILSRIDKQLDKELFEQIKKIPALEDFDKLIYCPTTEFMNCFVLENRNFLEAIGFIINLPSQSIYLKITSKLQSASIIDNILNIKTPPTLNWDNYSSPCVFKPKNNIEDGKILYPIICLSEKEASIEINRLSPSKWFIQKYISGQSYYLCGYLAKDGCYEYFWQVNMMQQANGKSIVLAKSDENPGVDVFKFFNGLFNLGYFGLIMMEILIDKDSNIYYIELNPRFWGPLQLALDVNPEILELFARDSGIDIKSMPASNKNDYWYSWSYGAKNSTCKNYPLIAHLDIEKINQLLRENDLYLKSDTLSLHDKR